jgi:hypothetical protein
MKASPSAPDLASDEPGARVARESRRSAAPEAGVRFFPDAGAAFAPLGGLELTRLEPPR